MREQVGERLGALRKAAKLTQNKLAERAGLQRVHVARLETGALKCSRASTRRTLAKAYGLPLAVFDDYLEGELALEAVVDRLAAEAVEVV